MTALIAGTGMASAAMLLYLIYILFRGDENE